jgi:hypothetical protein
MFACGLVTSWRATIVRWRVPIPDPDVGGDLALVAPVDFLLGPGDDLEPAVQTRQFIGSDAELFRDPGPGFMQVKLHTLVVAGETVLLDQPFMDDGTLDRDFRP